MAWKWWAILPLAAELLAAGIGASRAQTGASGPTVLAVDSLKPALDAIAAGWGGRPVVVTYAPAATMAFQLAGGLSADVVISDDGAALDALAKAGLIVAQTRRAIIGDDLVLVAPAEATAVLKIASGPDFARALGEGALALCDPASCPAGRLARQSLDTLKLWDAAQPKLAPQPDDRATLAAVARGAARLGVVFATEAKADGRVKVLDTFPASTYAPPRYAVALVKTSRDPQAAAFIAALRSSRSTKILRDLGYAVLR